MANPKIDHSPVSSHTVKMNFTDLTRFIKTFDGDRNKLSPFLRNCENALNLINPNQYEILFKFILSQLEGKAEAICSLKVFSNWSDLKQFLKSNFGECKHRNHLLLDLQNCRMKPNESALQYSTRLETHLTRLQTDISHSTINQGELLGRLANTEDLALHTFLLGLPSHISNILRCRNPENLAEAINLAIQEEKFYNYAQSSQSRNSVESKPKCRLCGKPGHTDRSCYSNRHRPIHNVAFQPRPSQSIPNTSPPNPTICAYCKAVGHHINQCRKREYNNTNRQRFSNPTNHQINSNPPLNKVHNLDENHDQTQECPTDPQNDNFLY
ncbi:hypothetical protein K1T71_009404 [Dendrolimus kikuchii]|uniref:Uncharacterized protein n=1 Tax=Dendrolimus kikuchii TaxID=765133 RepID=A0ACC1CUE9_9NEOP|nr:hypothetical protein K1T71_009404 [Dendrolimus kikuchii]